MCWWTIRGTLRQRQVGHVLVDYTGHIATEAGGTCVGGDMGHIATELGRWDMC